METFLCLGSSAGKSRSGDEMENSPPDRIHCGSFLSHNEINHPHCGLSKRIFRHNNPEELMEILSDGAAFGAEQGKAAFLIPHAGHRPGHQCGRNMFLALGLQLHEESQQAPNSQGFEKLIEKELKPALYVNKE
ncbi:hypothetical protein TURU_102584 [Turdus rufiventris]|nr:hypothetical protein TURU_102584 [Turdus rufiventris]